MTPWMTFLLAFLLGCLVGFLIDGWYRRRTYASLPAELATSRAEASRLKADVDAARGQVASLTTDLTAARTDNDTLRLQLATGQAQTLEATTLRSSLDAAQADNEALRRELNTLRQRLDEAEASGVGRAAPGLAAAGATLGAVAAGETAETSVAAARVADLEAQLGALRADLAGARKDNYRFRGRLVDAQTGAELDASDKARLRAELAQLTADLDARRAETSSLQARVAALTAAGAAGAVGGATLLADEEPGSLDVEGFSAPPAPRLDVDAPAVEAPDVTMPTLDVAVAAPAVEVPDLAGPKVDLTEGRPGAAAALAGRAKADTAEVEAEETAETLRADMPGLAATSPTTLGLEVDAPAVEAPDVTTPTLDVAVAAPAVEVPDIETPPVSAAKADRDAQADDLTVIEGIGPKIAQILNEGGIRTYWRLADTSVQTLAEMLTAAGPRYRMADPTTWPQQAALLAAGDLATFKALTDRLVGGRGGAESAPDTQSIAASAPPSPAPAPPRGPDNLTAIRGIGPSIAKVLSAAGITTYEALAAQTPDRLREIVIPLTGPNVEVTGWIVRARELSTRE